MTTEDRNDKMTRGAWLNILTAYRTYDDSEAVALRRIIEFMSRYENCFDRSLAAGHMTASAWLIDSSGCRALLTNHKKLNRWLQLGGHADGCSDLRAVALTEAREESGIDDIEFVSDSVFDVDVHAIPPQPQVPAHFHYDVRFLLRVMADDTFRVSDESHELKWFSPRELASLPVDAYVRRLARKWTAWLAGDQDAQEKGPPPVGAALNDQPFS